MEDNIEHILIVSNAAAHSFASYLKMSCALQGGGANDDSCLLAIDFHFSS